MSKRSQPGRDKQLAAALMLSYPQMFVWAIVFSLIGGFTVWSSGALTGNSHQSGNINLRLVNDANHDGEPNWGDIVTFDASTSSVASPVLQVSCYKNGQNVLYVQKSYNTGVQIAAARYIQLKSSQWTGGSADCAATLLKTNFGKTTVLSTSTFHVNE
jgi:hypothetical protein